MNDSARAWRTPAMRTYVYAAAVVTSSIAATILRAQPSAPPFWAGLRAGAYSVGFKSYWTRDATRAFGESHLETDGYADRDPSRPIRINVWYPSRAGGSSMRFGDYIGSAHTPGFEGMEKLVATEDLGADGKGVRGLVASDTAFARILRTRVAAHRDARIAKGKFPVVVYSLGQGDYTQENVPLCEYLASHGYIVLSVPQLGTSPRRTVMFIHDPPSYDAQVRDLAFALATVLHDTPQADPGRVGATGMSMGGVYALLLAMRYDGMIRTVVGLDPSFMGPGESFAYKYYEAPEFDRARFRGELLALFRDDERQRAPIVDSLRFANRTLVSIPHTIHVDFNGFPAYTAQAPAEQVDTFAMARRSQLTAARNFVAISEYVRCFLDATLARRESHASCPQIAGSDTESLPREAGPTEEELYDTLMRAGYTAALAQARTTPTPTPLRRAVMSRIANELGYAGRRRDAAKYASLGAVEFPDADMLERAGDAWAAIPDTASAAGWYRRALAVEPTRATAAAKLAQQSHP